MADTLLDYSEFVERSCVIHEGNYLADVTASEVEKSALRYIDQNSVPTSNGKVDYAYYMHILHNVWHYYSFWRGLNLGFWHHYNECPLCFSRITNPTHSNIYKSDLSFKQVYVGCCETCGWWETEEMLVDDPNLYPYGQTIHRTAHLRSFDFNGLDTPLELIKKHLIKQPSYLQRLTPRKLEGLLTSVFRDFFDCEAIHVGGPNDQGIDILLINGDYNCAVQVKRRVNPKKAEPVKFIREFIGAMILNSQTKGIYATTAFKFSSQSILASAKIANISQIEYIDLYNANRIIDVLKQISPPSIPNWASPATMRSGIAAHVTPGYNKFMEIAMGAPDWSTDLDILRDRKKQQKILKRVMTEFLLNNNQQERTHPFDRNPNSDL